MQTILLVIMITDQHGFLPLVLMFWAVFICLLVRVDNNSKSNKKNFLKFYMNVGPNQRKR